MNTEKTKYYRPAVSAPSRNVGVANANAKLTPDDIRMIRLLVVAGFSYRALAVKYGVHQSLIYQIVKGKIWGSVK